MPLLRLKATLSFTNTSSSDAQDSHTLLTLQLVHNRVNPCVHDPVLGLVHIRISDLASLCEGNTGTSTTFSML